MRLVSSERDLSEENDPFALCSKSCAEPTRQNRVWLETRKNNMSVQLCHQCQSNCQKNYRNDVSKHFSSRKSGKDRISHSNSIIWYRYFARYLLLLLCIEGILRRIFDTSTIF